MELTGKQKRHLRALAHHLKPVVIVGNGGASAAVIAKVEVELENHELIKVKVSKESPDDPPDVAEAVVEALGAHLAQIIGRTLVLYKRRKKDPAIRLPAATDA